MPGLSRHALKCAGHEWDQVYRCTLQYPSQCKTLGARCQGHSLKNRAGPNSYYSCLSRYTESDVHRLGVYQALLVLAFIVMDPRHPITDHAHDSCHTVSSVSPSQVIHKA